MRSQFQERQFTKLFQMGNTLGYAVADIVRAPKHFHLKTLETYTLISGVAAVHLGDATVILSRPGDTVNIPLGVHHWTEALGKPPARIGVHTVPAWTEEDYFLV